MARKPRSEWSPSYRRRIERAEARGLSRQAARGHKPREHVARREREQREAAALGKLTSPQRAAIRRFAAKQAKRGGEDVAASKQKMVGWATRVGYDRFLALRDQVAAASAQYRGQRSRGAYESAGEGVLDYWIDDLDTPDDPAEAFWFYYH